MSYLPIGRNTKDITGQVFGRLTALGVVGRQASAAMWECRCECGNIKAVRASSLLNGHSKSCGCFQKERVSSATTKHRKSFSPVYKAWHNMLQRCTNPKNTAWRNYGGRGIGVCESWFDFSSFYRDMGDPQDGMQLDRKDNNGDYCKENCSWVTRSENNRNTRRNVFITSHGVTACVTEHADAAGIKRNTVYSRLRRGLKAEAALTPAVNINGIT